MKSLVALIAFLFAVQIEAAPKHVIVISVDGLGDHLLSVSHAPNIKALETFGMKAPHAETILPPRTVPGHISMLTGVLPERHGITHNQLDEVLPKISVPSIFDLLKSNQLEGVAVLGKEKLRFVFDTGGVTRFHQESWPIIGEYAGHIPNMVEDAARGELHENKPSFLFVHYALADTMGHWFKWESWIQKWAVSWIDRSVGRLLEDAKNNLGEGNYVLILTADHGGHRGAHGQTKNGKLENPETDLVIPWYIVGAKLNPEIKTVFIYDTAPTVANLLGLKVPDVWNWQGRSVVPSAAP